MSYKEGDFKEKEISCWGLCGMWHRCKEGADFQLEFGEKEQYSNLKKKLN